MYYETKLINRKHTAKYGIIKPSGDCCVAADAPLLPPPTAFVRFGLYQSIRLVVVFVFRWLWPRWLPEMNEFIVYFLSKYSSRSADCCVVSNLLRPHVPLSASRLIVVWFLLFLWAPMAPVLPAGGESSARAIFRSLVAATAAIVLAIFAQSMTLTRRPVDNVSDVAVAVFSGKRLAYGGGRHGFGGAR